MVRDGQSAPCWEWSIPASLAICLESASQTQGCNEVSGSDQGKKKFGLAVAFQNGCLREYPRHCLTETGQRQACLC